MASAELTKKDILHYLRFLRNAGFLYLTPTKGGPTESAHARAEQLEALKLAVAKCTQCRLCEGRTHVVFGEGNPDADLMFVGEGPGAEEDRLGRPFVGRSGKLLDQMIERVGLKREDVFIGNVVKCRPPDNRDPELDEMETCEPFLKSQIALIQPRVIVALGRFAAHRLTGEKTPIGRMRGHFYSYADVKLMPTLHPAAVLRNMNQLQDVIHDLERAVAEIQRD
ncbi:uracil-DNA glycosylase [bacterium]|nr:uracil-DNA glycosylase [bacterium]